MNVYQEVVTDQMMIQEVMNNEADYLARGDFENWASCMVKNSLTYYALTPTFAEQFASLEAFGWEEVSEKVKALMTTGEHDLGIRTQFVYKIMDNMAFVTFSINHIKTGSCVLEKMSDEWCILRMTI